MGKKQPKPSMTSPHIPSPFAVAPEGLHEFLNTLDRDKVYITHLDTQPIALKKRIFAVPVVLNVCISALLLWRIYSIYPAYLDLILFILGQNSAAAIDMPATSWGRFVRIVLGRAAMMALDYFLATIVAMWPYSFFLEAPGNPCRWRWAVGVQACEVVVRKSRGWGRDDLLGGPVSPRDGDGGGGGDKAAKVASRPVEDSPFFKVRVLPAIDAKWMRDRTGYVMMGKDWDLDFQAMVDATTLVQKLARNSLDDFKKAVFVWNGDDVGWLSWDVWRLEEEGVEADGRRKIVAFKEKLTLMGKESLFFRWIEIVQYESSSSSSSSHRPDRKAELVTKARELFEGVGVDFDQFLAEIGGVAEFPGLDV